MRIRYLLVLPLLLPLASWAQSAADASAGSGYSSGTAATSSPSHFGSQTEDWINLQVSGRESVKKSPPLSGAVATHIYQRYVKSFDHAIPDHFSRQNFVQNGGGSSQSGG